MMTVIVPSEMKGRIRKKAVLRIGVFVGVLILIALAFFFCPPLAELERNNKALTFYACVLLDLLATGVPLKLIGRSWQGEVVGVQVKTSTETSNPSKPTSSSWYTANTVILSVKTPKGDVVVEKAESTNSQHSEREIGRYEKGDYVARIHGAEYPAHYKAASNETRCVLCGSYSSNDRHECERCGNALVTFLPQTSGNTEKDT